MAEEAGTRPAAARYCAQEVLRDGRRALIRAQSPDDREAMAAAARQTSERTRYLRFFAPKRSMSEREVAFLMDADFVNQVALVAILEEDGKPLVAGGGRYIIVKPGSAEVAFLVVDACQGLGIGSLLMRHLAILGRAAGLSELVAEVLPDNMPMLGVFRKSGCPMKTRRGDGVVHVLLDLKGSPP
ncbi:MAG: GNAT family N-acetyltransferase [Betaproteobacteria bacterium]|nr:GNAT family N-acetyltransferase [Betaproteobacteria bacterium]